MRWDNRYYARREEVSQGSLSLICKMTTKKIASVLKRGSCFNSNNRRVLCVCVCCCTPHACCTHTRFCATVSVHLASHSGGSSLVFFWVNAPKACSVLQTWTQPVLSCEFNLNLMITSCLLYYY